jgi:adenylate kinase family enzyme
MVNYQFGKIYKIIGGSECYIGSTAEKYLSNRYGSHKSKYKCYKNTTAKYACKSCYLFDTYGVDNCSIELIESFPCNSVEELRAREGFHQRNTECVNRNIADRKVGEYYIDNRDKLLENKKQYWVENKEELMEKNKKWKEDNAEQNRKNANVYHKNVVSKKKYMCECGKTLQLKNKKTHESSTAHKDKIKNIPTL